MTRPIIPDDDDELCRREADGAVVELAAAEAAPAGPDALHERPKPPFFGGKNHAALVKEGQAVTGEIRRQHPRNRLRGPAAQAAATAQTRLETARERTRAPMKDHGSPMRK